MRRINRTLPVSVVIVLAAGGFVGVTVAYVQAEIANAAPAAAHGSATTTTPVSAGTRTAGAKSPAGLLQLLGERIKAKDVDGIIALHEPEAAIVDWDGSIIRGHKAIRKFYIEWFKLDPVLTVEPLQTVVAGGKRSRDGSVYKRTGAIMGRYKLEQNTSATDKTRISFTGNFCDTVQEQSDGTWLYVQDNPYPPHGGAAAPVAPRRGGVQAESPQHQHHGGKAPSSHH